MPKALTIQKDDKQFADFPHFDELRQLGIDYISSFSGDLWTDHNLHDPGITILEILSYALTDLGYRTSLDIGELLAPENGTTKENNFFTPEEILTCNPLTILDFRRMLVDIEGVRNAWLVPAEEQEVIIYYQNNSQALSYVPPQAEEGGINLTDCGENELKLNGLYKVYLDIDPAFLQGEDACGQKANHLSGILAEVEHRLHQHRNLCEDFIDIVVLNDEEIGICADIEMEPNARPDEVLLKVYEAVEALISPRLFFYSLKELLQANKPIEEIYQGRPYTPLYASRQAGEDKFSHGFVDVEQLKTTQLPTELFASDFYRVIMEVDGVRAIRQLYLKNFLGGQGDTNSNGEPWRLVLTPDHRPIFSPDRSLFKFFKGVLRVPFNGVDQVRERFRKRLADFQKAKYHRSDLDLSIPYGRHRKDLGDYYSVQNEFPTVYGIGNGDLSTDASAERKVQALQLKAYLTFYDQLLANYLSQLAHLRDLFALANDTGGGGTYFSQIVESIPQLSKLVRFYQDRAVSQETVRDVLASSSTTFSHPVERDLTLQQLIGQLAAFDSLDIQRRIVLVENEGCYTFSINDASGHPLLESVRSYPSEEEARQVIQSVLFQGLIEKNYERENRPANHCYTFHLVDNPQSNLEFLQRIVETPQLFHKRRDQFLNHLLARFGEQFTEYVLLMYALNQGHQDPDTIIEDKERFLANYPTISRNRGKGFNYRDTSELWNSKANLSGLEVRVSHLMGLDNWERRNLNPFKVDLRDQACYLQIKDHRGRILFQSVEAYADPADAQAAAEAIHEQLCKKEAYQLKDCVTNSIYSFCLLGKDGKVIATFERTFPSAEIRDKQLECTLNYFCEPLGIRTAIVRRKNLFGFEVYDGKGNTLLESSTEYSDKPSVQLAAQAMDRYLRSDECKLISYPNRQDKGYGISVSTTGKVKDLEAVVARYPIIYQEKVARDTQRSYLKSYFKGLLQQPTGVAAQLVAENEGYYFQLLSEDGTSVYLQSCEGYEDTASACRAFTRLLEVGRVEENYIETSGSFHGGRYSFKVIDGEDDLACHPIGYTKINERNLALQQVMDFIQGRRLEYQIKQEPLQYYWCAQEEGGVLVMQNEVPFQSEAEAFIAWEELQDLFLDQERYQIKAANGQWMAELQRQDGLVVAQSNAFNDQAELRLAVQTLVEYWQAHPDQLPLVEEREGAFYFVLHFDQEEALVGTRRYDNHQQARCAFHRFSKLAADAAHYEVFEEEGTCKVGFGVREEGEWVALNPDYWLPEEQVNYQEKLVEHIAKNFFPFEIKMLPGSWHYEILWENCEGECDVLLVENGSHLTEVEAKEQLDAFLDQLSSLQWDLLDEDGSEEGFSFGLSDTSNVTLALHPHWYATAEERDAVVEDAQAYLLFYQKLRDGDRPLFNKVDEWWICGKSPTVCATSFEQEELFPDTAAKKLPNKDLIQPHVPLGEGCLLSGFRLLKDEQPLAIHPHCYYTREERDEMKAELFEKAKCKEYVYSDLCLSGSPVVRKIEHRYYYEWWENRGAEESVLLWRSVQGYDTEELARHSFEEEWPKLMVAAKSRENYQPLTSALPYLSLCLDDEVRLFLPETLVDTLAEEEAIDYRHRFAQQYPLVQRNGLFYYQLFDVGTNTVFWQSNQGFPSAQAAWQGLLLFLETARYEGNFRCLDQEESSIFEIVLIETLLVSRRTYADEFVAVTIKTPDVTQGIDDHIEYASPRLFAPISPSLIQFPTQYSTSIQELSPDNWQIGIDPKDAQGASIQSISPLTTFEAAHNALNLYQELIDNPENLVISPVEGTSDYIALAYLGSSIEDEGKITGQPKEYVICPAEYHTDRYQLGDLVSVGVQDLCAKDQPDHVETICPQAWSVGLETFLIYGISKENYYPYLDAAKDCKYSFRVVTDQYRVARNPWESHTGAEREALLNWLYHYSNCSKRPLEAPYDIEVFAKRGRCYYQLSYQGEIHWQSYAGFLEEKKAFEAYRDRTLELMAYIQQPDCYELIEQEDDGSGVKKYKIAIVDDEGRYVLITKHCYTEDAYEAAILKRILHARRYPYFEYQGQFGFHCFSLEDLPDFTVPITDSLCHDDEEVKQDAGHWFASIAGLVQVEVPGEVIWESVHDYDSLDEAKCVFKCFLRLLTERSNYQRTTLADCNLFGIELTHPDEVLATHPGCYPTEGGVQRAIEQTLSCVNSEGFHLTEHILLRPKQGGPGIYSVRFRYPQKPKGEECDYYDYLNLPLSSEIYPEKEEAEEQKELLWAQLEECLRAYLTADLDGGDSEILNREDLQNYLLNCIRQIKGENADKLGLHLTLDDEQMDLLAGALAGVDSPYVYFENVFLEPRLAADGQCCLVYRYRVSSENGEGEIVDTWYVASASTQFMTCEAAEEALEVLLMKLEQCIVDFITAQGDPSREELAEEIKACLSEVQWIQSSQVDQLTAALLDWQLRDVFFCFSPAPVEASDTLMPTCPDCDHLVGLPSEEASEEGCEAPMKSLLKEEAPSAAFPPGTELYVPGADPYSFWATVVIPYWPERFQNSNLRLFFEDTLRRETPAHIALRICWLDPKQMYVFDHYYRNWLEANSNQDSCLLQEAKRCLIDLLFSLSTVYPPARLQGGGCAEGATEPGAILLNSTQLG